VGACYDVYFQLKYQNKQNAVAALDNFIRERLADVWCGASQVAATTISANKSDSTAATMSEPMSYILPQTCHWVFDEENGSFYAAFDTRYSWLTLLWDSFEAMFPWLQDDSALEIWQDNDYCKLSIENGSLHFEGEGFWYH